MSSDVEPIGPPWRDGQHCRHCHPQCDGQYDPHDGGVYHEVGEAFTWHPEYGCPLCAHAELLRGMAAEASKESASWHGSASLMETYGHHAGAEADRREAATLSRIAAALRDAADHIENGDHR